MRVTNRPILAGALATFVAGCDPLLDIDGSFFPAWMLCLIVGVTLTAFARQLLARAGLEPHLGPLLVVYPCLGLLVTLVTWLLLYRT
jgi:hypothetical protein